MTRKFDWFDLLDLLVLGFEAVALPSIHGSFYDTDWRLLRRLERERLLAREGTGRDAKFTITEKGRQQGADFDPRRSWNSPWDKRWRLVTFDIPEHRRKDRLTLRRELRAQRFGLLQRSVWVSPHDVEAVLQEIIQAKGIPECFAVFEADRLILCSNEEVVRTAWDFKQIAQDHASYLKGTESRREAIRKAETMIRLMQLAREERLEFAAALADDPLLPRELWPPDYGGMEVLEAHRAIRSELGEGFGRLRSKTR